MGSRLGEEGGNEHLSAISGIQNRDIDKKEDLFQFGCVSLAARDFKSASTFFANYLRYGRVRVDSDMDLANLIGLGLSWEARQEYRFAEGYYHLARTMCLRQWLIIPQWAVFGFFSSDVYGFRRLEPFLGPMRLAAQRRDLTAGFYWSEWVHHLKEMERNISTNGGAQVANRANFGARVSFASLFSKMGQALDLNDRALFLKLASKASGLREEYPEHGSEIAFAPVKPSKVPLGSNERLLTYVVDEDQTFGWLVQNGRVVKNIVIAIARGDLNSIVNDYLSLEQSGEATHLEEKLSALLLDGFLSDADALERVIIVPDDVLTKLPFERIVNFHHKLTNGKAQDNLPPLRVETRESATSMR
jgi:hypothetical protein